MFYFRLKMTIQGTDNFGHVFRYGRLEYDFITAGRVNETQISGMQHLAGYPNSVAGGHFKCADLPTGSVNPVTDHRIAQRI